MKMIQHDPSVVVLTPKDILKIFPHIKTSQGAFRHYHNVRDAIGKPKHQRLTVKEFAEYEGLPLMNVLNIVIQ